MLLFVLSAATEESAALAEFGRQALRLALERPSLVVAGARFGGASAPAFLADAPSCEVALGAAGVVAAAEFFAWLVSSSGGGIRGAAPTANSDALRAADGAGFLRDVGQWARHLRDDPEGGETSSSARGLLPEGPRTQLRGDPEGGEGPVGPSRRGDGREP